MGFRWQNDLTQDDVPPEAMWLNRRQIMAGALGAAALGSIASPALAAALEPNKYDDIISYNNFYEFGLGKDDPAENAKNFTCDGI